MKSRFGKIRQDLEVGWLKPATPVPSATFLSDAERALSRIVADTCISEPHVYPTPRGGIQAEWDLASATLSLEIVPREERLAYEGMTTSEAADLDNTAELEVVVRWVGLVAGTGRPYHRGGNS